MHVVEKLPPIAPEDGDRETVREGAATTRDEDRRVVSRRAFLHQTGLAAAAAALVDRWGEAARAAGPDLTTDTLNGLVAFIVPGPDAYSLQQGVSTPEPGGIDANTTAPLIFSLNLASLAPPPFPGFADLVAFVLNNVAQVVNPTVAGPFSAPFANLSFDEKVLVFAAMESGAAGPDLVPLGGALPVFVAFIAYSEAGVFDPTTRTLTGVPVGWLISGYDGVADGRDEFLGYFQNRRKVSG